MLTRSSIKPEVFVRILGQLPLLAFASEGNRGVVYASEAFAAMIGCDDVGQLTGRPVIDLFTDRRGIEHLIALLERDEVAKDFPTVLARRGYQPVNVEVTAVLVQGQILAICSDSDLSKAEHLEAVERERFLEAVIDQVPAAICLKDHHGRVVFANRAYAALYGVPSARLEGRTDADLNPDAESVEDILRQDHEVLRGLSRTIAVEQLTHQPSGEKRHYQTARVPLTSDGESRQRVLSIATDISVLLRAEEELAAERERYRQLVESASDVICRIDLEGRITYMNPVGLRMLGVSESTLKNTRFTRFVRSDYRADVMRFYGEQLNCGTPTTYLEIPARTADGHTLWLGSKVQLVRSNDVAMGFQAVARDISDRKRLEERLSHLATHDSLTSLCNRRHFEAQLDERLANYLRDGTRGAILWIDVDSFKEVNDRFGHSFGDAFLVGFAELLRSSCRDGDLVARIGGDEFALLLEHGDLSGIERLAQRILSRVRSHSLSLEGQRIRVTASIGAALFPEHGLTRDQLMKRADLALYKAKREGRDRFCLFQPHANEMSASLATRFEELRHAIIPANFRLSAQPVVDLHGGGILCFELLLRLQKSRHEKLLEASKFLDLAEQLNQIRQIDRWVVHQAFSLLSESKDDRLVFGVNISSKSLTDRRLIDFIETRLNRLDLDPSRVIFEITESAAIDSLRDASAFISVVSNFGCRFALDDFGVGFSSLHRLKSLPVDFLKIDGTFVQELEGDADRALIRAIVDVAGALGKKTIAEYVETVDAYDMLREIGVDYAQGYHVGESQPVEDVMA